MLFARTHGVPSSRLHRRLAVPLLLVAVRAADGQADHATHTLGLVDFQVSCAPATQSPFNRAVALLHHMTYPQARMAFQEIVAGDPTCAMAHWGIAMTRFQPLWPTRPDAAALQRGWTEAEQATALAKTPRDQLFAAAVKAFYQDPTSTDYWLRVRRWEAAMAAAHTTLPDDDEVSVFYALAHLAVTRSDTVTRANADRAADLLVGVYRRNPDHPGAMHYLVHANDVPTRERELLAVTRRYDAVAPRNPHALHMPTHIYTRLGEWNNVVSGNLRAAAAALEYPAGERGEFVWDEYPHAVEYVIYAYLQQAADDSAGAALQRLLATARLEPTFKTAFHLASTQARYALERRDWSAASAIIPRQPAWLAWDRFGWPEAISHFARGLGAVHLGQLDEARAASARMDTLEQTSQRAREELFVRNIRILKLQLNAWLAHVEGDAASSTTWMREAVVLEASTPKHPVTPAPTIPALELLGDLLLEQKNPREALDAYRGSLARYPNLFNSVLGAARAAVAAGETEQAKTYYRQLLSLAQGGGRASILAEARTYARDSTGSR
jgi:tetratricopeptide (TPR) repeat protein